MLGLRAHLKGAVPPLLAATWLTVGALLLRIAVAGRFKDIALGPVGRSGMVALFGLVLPLSGLLAAASLPTVAGRWPQRASQGIGIAVTILGGGLLLVGHDSAAVIAGLGLVGYGLARIPN